jgi:serine/threonine-protein kinase HipA
MPRPSASTAASGCLRSELGHLLTRIRSLDVYLGDDLVAEVATPRSGKMTLTYRPDAVERFGEGAMALSASLPVRTERYSPSEVAPFLDGLLPDGWARAGLERRFDVHRVDSFSLLAAIGRECAGAVSLVPTGAPSPSVPSEPVVPLDDRTVAILLAQLEQDPFGVDDDTRLTLAGTPWKLPLTRTADGGWARPRRGAWSTHLVRPEPPDLGGLVATEAFSLGALRDAGVRVVAAEALSFGGSAALVVERFDRVVGADGSVMRLHQEDCCQALGAARAERAERDGGPTLVEIADLVNDMAWDPEAELILLLQWVAATLVFGKVDATARDLALTYSGGECRLAPIASMAGTADFPDRGQQLGLSVGGVEDLDRVGRRQLIDEAKRWGMPAEVAATVLDDLVERLGTALDAARQVIDPGDEVVAAFRRRLHHLAF